MMPPIHEYQRLSIALLSPCFLLLLPFLHVYSNNVTNLQLPISWFLSDLGAFSLALAVAVYVILKISPKFIEGWLAVILMFFIVLAWLQTNFFIGEFGFFTGDVPDWREDRAAHVLQTILLFLLFIGFLVFARVLLNNLVFISALLLITSLAYMPQLLENISGTNDKKYTFTKEGVYDFSSSSNVIVFVLDSVQADVAHEILSRNDTLRERYAGFSLFRNAVGLFPKTYASIPALISGKAFDNSQPLSDYLWTVYREDSVSSRLQRFGFDARYWSSAPHALLAHPLVSSNVRDAQGEADSELVTRDKMLITNMMKFRLSPHLLKPLIYSSLSLDGASPKSVPERNALDDCVLTDDQRRYSIGRRTFDNLFVDEFGACAKVNFSKPVFRFYHLYAPHSPYQLDEKFNYIGRKPLNRTWFMAQTEGALWILSEMIQVLKDIDVFDNSLILIVSDHGEGEYPVGINYDQAIPSRPKGKQGAPDGVVRGGMPLVMGRLPDSLGEMQVSDAPVSLLDIPATIYTATGISNPTIGKSIFSISEDSKRVRLHRHYKFNGWNIDYILPMTEYAVQGFSWYPENWAATNRDFSLAAANGFDGSLVTLQAGGSITEFSNQGWREPTANGSRIGDQASIVLDGGNANVLSIKHALHNADTKIDIMINDTVVGVWDFLADDGQREKTLTLPVALNGDVKVSFQLRSGPSPLIREIRIQSLHAFSYELGTKIDFTDVGNSSIYRTHGWSRTEFWGTSSIGYESGIVLGLTQKLEQDLFLNLHFSGYVYPNWPEQKVEILANGQTIELLSVTQRARRAYKILVPKELVLENGLLALNFRYLNPVVQSVIGVAADNRLQAIGMNHLSLDFSDAEL
ncbi:MAG: sulfatase-like hydrolase/transferase [Candidatus Azotimanducaceae bacterium]|uniref:Sulfatase N-terminal domain-containing protein n=1 Tax=OM182 bacterium TaxID=2510334 RepID=A0A520S2X1_9GAMM|nr:MAG: hypothetical protein EVA68_02995 [OM182 bacterium]